LSRSRHSTLEGSSGGSLGYSPEEADTHFQRYSGGSRVLTARSTSVQEPPPPEPEASAVAEETVLSEREDDDEEAGSDRGEEAVEVPVLILPDSLKERLETDLKSIRGI
jgi:hypothetical protein